MSAAVPSEPGKLAEPSHFSLRLQPLQTQADREGQKQDQNQRCDAHDDAPVVVVIGRHRSRKCDLHCDAIQKNLERCKNLTDSARAGSPSPAPPPATHSSKSTTPRRRSPWRHRPPRRGARRSYPATERPL